MEAKLRRHRNYKKVSKLARASRALLVEGLSLYVSIH